MVLSVALDLFFDPFFHPWPVVKCIYNHVKSDPDHCGYHGGQPLLHIQINVCTALWRSRDGDSVYVQDSMFVSEAQPRHSQGMTSDENPRLREYLSKYIYIYIYAQYVWSYEIGTVTMINDQRFCVLESSSWSSILHLQITFVNHVVLFVSITEAVKRIQQCTAEIRKEAWNAVIAISKGKFYKLHRSWGQPAVPIHLCCSTEEGTWRTPLPSQNLVAVPPRLRIPCMLVTRPCRMPNSVLRRHITLWQVLIGVVGVVRGGIKLTLPFGCAWIGNAFLCQLSYNGGNTFGEQRNRSLMQQKLSVLDKKQVCYKGSFLEPSAFIAKMLLWLRHGREG